MLKAFFLIVITICFSFNVYSEIVFDDFFENKTIRYDFELIGNDSCFEAVHIQTKELKEWGGNPYALLDELDYGTFRYTVLDIDSNVVIFKKNMALLAIEWQTTDEAKCKKKSFYHSAFFPKPKSDVKLIFEVRDELNEWRAIYFDTIRMDDYFIINESIDSYNLDTLIYNGNSSEKIDLVIISEGYKENEMDKFIADSDRLTDTLFSAKPFSDFSDRFNVFLLKVPSVDSGTDVPGEHIYRNTAFNSNFYTFNSPRYLTTFDMKSVYDAVDGLVWDQLYLLVNTDRYGGGGFYNFLNVCSSDNERSAFVFAHEFGHGFAGLGDEYYASSTSYETYYNVLFELWEPNLTTLVDFNSKWEDMINDELPIPTPRDSVYFDRVGVFEGGGYQAKGIYSPFNTCWMKESTAIGFCPVCCEAIKKAILLQTK